jgi:hypothetical protein
MIAATTSSSSSNTTVIQVLQVKRSMTLAYEKSGTMRALDWFCFDTNNDEDEDNDDIHCQMVAASLSRLQIWNQTSRTINSTASTTTAKSTANILTRAENNDSVNVLLKAPTEWIWHGVLEASHSPSLMVRTLAHSPAVGDHRLAVGTFLAP